MLINQNSGSGGDAMPWYFRKAGIGKLVGTRTWGGLVGIGGYPSLLDGGRVTYDSGPLEIGFQARYLNDITDQIGEQVEFRFSDGAAPTVGQDAADASGLYVLMPMRV